MWEYRPTGNTQTACLLQDDKGKCVYMYNLCLAQTACLLQDDKGKCVWSMKAKRQVKEAVFLKAPWCSNGSKRLTKTSCMPCTCTTNKTRLGYLKVDINDIIKYVGPREILPILICFTTVGLWSIVGGCSWTVACETTSHFIGIPNLGLAPIDINPKVSLTQLSYNPFFWWNWRIWNPYPGLH